MGDSIGGARDEVTGGGVTGGAVPSVAEARALAGELLGVEGTRLAHVGTAGTVAQRLSALFAAQDAQLLVVAATLHDVGYSPRIAHAGFHPLDGGRFLLAQGLSPRLAGLVANHSWAALHADSPDAEALAAEFPREEGLLSDALAYSDMHSAPDGRIIPAQRRLEDIAARHPDPRQLDRARALRASIVRVGHALLEAGAQDPNPTAWRQRWSDRHAGLGGGPGAPEASWSQAADDEVRRVPERW